MKPVEYNKEAREAFGKTLVDVGMAIFKGVILIFTVVPITIILKSSLDGNGKELSLLQIFGTMSQGTYFLLICFLTASFWIGHSFRKEGLRHIHEANQENA